MEVRKIQVDPEYEENQHFSFSCESIRHSLPIRKTGVQVQMLVALSRSLTPTLKVKPKII